MVGVENVCWCDRAAIYGERVWVFFSDTMTAYSRVNADFGDVGFSGVRDEGDVSNGVGADSDCDCDDID